MTYNRNLSIFAENITSGGVLTTAGGGTGATTATGSAANLQYQATGGVARSYQSKFGDFVSVLDFGADPTGVADSTSAFVNALATNKSVYIPDGIYAVTDNSISMTRSGQKLYGSAVATYGIGSFTGAGVLIKCTNNSGNPVIKIGANVNEIELCNFTLTRTASLGTLVSGSHGIVFAGNTELTHIHDLIVDNQNVGVVLGSTSWSVLERVISQRNTSDGFYMQNASGVNACQWQWLTLLSSQNGGRGYTVASTNAGGVTQITLGDWDHISSFANTSNGIGVFGIAACPIQSIRLTNMFLGQDGASELYLDTYGNNHKISIGFIELCGTSPTGPSLTTAASNVGNGINISANNTATIISDVIIVGNSASGVLNSSSDLCVHDCRIANNGVALISGNQIGLYNFAGNISVLSGCSIKNSGATTQTYSVYNNTVINVCVANDLKTGSVGNYGGTAAVIGGTTLNNQ